MKKLLQLKTMLLLCALIVGSGSVWAQVASVAPENGKSYVIAVYSGNKYYAMPNTSVNGGTIGGVEVTLNRLNKVSTENAAGKTWSFEEDTNNSGQFYLKYTEGNNVHYLYKNGTSASNYNFKSTAGNDKNYWKFEANGAAYTVTAVNRGSNNTKIQYNSGSFRCYSSATNIILLEVGDVNSSPLASIDVTGTPTDFCLGDAWNTDGMTVTATYEDNSTATVTGEFSGYNKAMAGEQTITVSYTEGDVTATDTYTITGKNDTGLTLGGSYKTEFWTGDTFSSTGLTATAQFEGGLTRSAITESLKVSDPDMSTAGGKTVTVSYTIEGVTKSANYNITVTDKPLYTITWMVNGVKHSSRKVTMDELIGEFPTPSAIDGKTFAGWVPTATVAPNYSAGYVNTATATATGNITYYAVFAEATHRTIVDELNRALTGITGTQYTSWSGKQSNSDAIYAGKSAGGNTSIQLRTSDSNEGIITTVSGGKLKKVTVVWNSNTSNGRTLNVYGKNSVYGAVTNLYNNDNQGTLLGTIVYGTSTELEVNGDYAYIGLRSNSNAMYLTSISITWDVTTYTYTTTPAAKGTTVTVGSTGYATFVYPYAVAIPANVEAYVVKEANSTSAKLTTVENNIPANTPVVLKAAANDYTFNVADGEVDAISGNLLKVSDETTGNGVYVLANGDDGVGFYEWTGGSLGAGRVYLDAPNAARTFLAFDFDEESTGIDTAKLSKNAENGVVYNLAGQRVANPAKGLYIVNGKKVIIK